MKPANDNRKRPKEFFFAYGKKLRHDRRTGYLVDDKTGDRYDWRTGHLVNETREDEPPA